MLRPGLRADALVFALTLLGVGYFHQGGGWNQNARFALVRSIVEEGSFFIDDFLVYTRPKGTSASDPLVRLPVRCGNFDRDGTAYAMAWDAHTHELLPVDPATAGTRRLAAVEFFGATGDVSYFGGHFHPNKAPGTSWLAVPGYALVRGAEKMLGISPDGWAALTVGAWLTSLLSVGLATALAAVLVLRLARRFGSEAGARFAAVSFAFATMAWPYGTFLFEHNIIAACLVGAFYLLETAVDEATGKRPAARLHAAGLVAGYAAITNYTMAVLVAAFAFYLLARSRSARALACYGAGVLWPLAAILAYNQVCFGTPFTTNYAFESPLFRSGHHVLGVFALPSADVAGALLFSPYRGLFYTSPLLMAAVVAAGALLREGRRRAEIALVFVVFAFLLFVNASFNGWDGGWTAVPRYLGPAMALLAIPLAFAFDRWRSITIGLAAVSFVIQFLLTAVDPQVPIGDAGAAGSSVASVFRIDPMTRYVVPIFVEGRPWPMLEESIEESVQRASRVAESRGAAEADVRLKGDALRSDLYARLARGEPTPLLFGDVLGPVSANPIGLCEGFYGQVFPALGLETRGNSFNAGEWIFPEARMSLAPLLALGTLLLLALFRDRDDEDAEARPELPR